MGFWLDIKYASRLLLKDIRFSLATILIMVAGLTICIFTISLSYLVYYKNLPIQDADRRVVVASYFSAHDHRLVTELEIFELIRDRAKSFEYFDFFQPAEANIRYAEKSQHYLASRVSPTFFDYFDAQPIQGRAILDSDIDKDAEDVALISYQLWQEVMAGRANAVGEIIWVNSEPVRVVGIMPKKFRYPFVHDIWIASGYHEEPVMESKIVIMYGKLNPGVSIRDAQKELDAINEILLAEDHDIIREDMFRVRTLPQGISNGAGIILVQTIVVFLVLFLAVINVSNLLLTRAGLRGKETAIRVAMGATQGRLIMQMMWESVIICMVGVVLALLLAQVGLEWMYRTIVTLSGGFFPAFWVFVIDIKVVIVSILLAMVIAVITGVLPAWRISRGNFNQVLRDSSYGTASLRRKRFNKLIVIFEVAVTTGLLLVTSMMVIENGFAELADYGFETENALVARVNVHDSSHPNEEDKAEFYFNLFKELQKIEGTKGVTLVNPLIGQGNDDTRDIQLEGYDFPAAEAPKAFTAQLMPGGLKAFGIELKAGRYFNESDKLGSEPVAIVTDAFIDRYLPGETDIVGKRIRLIEGRREINDIGGDKWMRVVGVVNQVIYASPFKPFRDTPVVFTPMRQNQNWTVNIVVWGDESFRRLVPDVKQALFNTDPNMPPYRINDYDHEIQVTREFAKMFTTIFMVFSGCALIFSITGVYVVVASVVQQRTQEIGVRRAMGAPDRVIVKMLMMQGWKYLLIGLLCGLPLAYLLGLAFFQRGITYPASYSMILIVPCIISLIVTIAIYIPAKRAVQKQPAAAIRYE